MKSHPTQFGARENTASPRPHASRLAVQSAEVKSHGVSTVSDRKPLSPADATSQAGTLASPLTEHANGTTGEEERDQKQLLTVHEVANLLQVPASWVYEHTRPQCSNPLPCLKVGKYLRFLSIDIAKYLEGTRSIHRVSR